MTPTQALASFLFWILDKAGEQTLDHILKRRRLTELVDETIADWFESLPDDLHINIETISDQLVTQVAESTDAPSPDIDLGEEIELHLLQSWKKIKTTHPPEKLTNFFHQSEEDARTHLQNLARRLKTALMESEYTDRLKITQTNAGVQELLAHQAHARAIIAYCIRNLRDVEDPRARLKKAEEVLTLSPTGQEKADLLHTIGATLYVLGDPQRAASRLEQASEELSPYDEEKGLYLKAKAQLVAGKYDDLKATVTRAQKRFPGSERFEIMSVWLDATHAPDLDAWYKLHFPRPRRTKTNLIIAASVCYKRNDWQTLVKVIRDFLDAGHQDAEMLWMYARAQLRNSGAIIVAGGPESISPTLRHKLVEIASIFDRSRTLMESQEAYLREADIASDAILSQVDIYQKIGDDDRVDTLLEEAQKKYGNQWNVERSLYLRRENAEKYADALRMANSVFTKLVEQRNFDAQAVVAADSARIAIAAGSDVESLETYLRTVQDVWNTSQLQYNNEIAKAGLLDAQVKLLAALNRPHEIVVLLQSDNDQRVHVSFRTALLGKQHLEMGNREDALRAASSACMSLDAAAPAFYCFILADLLHKLGRWHKCIHILDRFAILDLPAPVLYIRFDSLERAGKLKTLLDELLARLHHSPDDSQKLLGNLLNGLRFLDLQGLFDLLTDRFQDTLKGKKEIGIWLILATFFGTKKDKIAEMMCSALESDTSPVPHSVLWATDDPGAAISVAVRELLRDGDKHRYLASVLFSLSWTPHAETAKVATPFDFFVYEIVDSDSNVEVYAERDFAFCPSLPVGILKTYFLSSPSVGEKITDENNISWTVASKTPYWKYLLNEFQRDLSRSPTSSSADRAVYRGQRADAFVSSVQTQHMEARGVFISRIWTLAGRSPYRAAKISGMELLVCLESVWQSPRASHPAPMQSGRVPEVTEVCVDTVAFFTAWKCAGMDIDEFANLPFRLVFRPSCLQHIVSAIRSSQDRNHFMALFTNGKARIESAMHLCKDSAGNEELVVPGLSELIGHTGLEFLECVDASRAVWCDDQFQAQLLLGTNVPVFSTAAVLGAIELAQAIHKRRLIALKLNLWASGYSQVGISGDDVSTVLSEASNGDWSGFEKLIRGLSADVFDDSSSAAIFAGLAATAARVSDGKISSLFSQVLNYAAEVAMSRSIDYRRFCIGVFNVLQSSTYYNVSVSNAELVAAKILFKL